MRKKLMIVISIILIGAILRLWQLNKPDINLDEEHYITDAYRLSNQDPYMPLRRHTFKHFSPSMGHPLLAAFFTTGIFKFTGASIFTARLTSVIAGLLIIVLLACFNRELGNKAGVVAALLFAVLPFAIRYNRTAYLDSVFAYFFTFIALASWMYHSKRHKLWLILIGISCGLAVATKIDGIIAVILAIFLLFLSVTSTKSKSNKEKLLSLIINIFYITAPAVLIGLLFNDPSAYLDGIINPSDSKGKLFSPSSISALRFVPSNLWYTFFYQFSPAILVLSIIMILVLIKEKSFVSRFLLCWMGVTSIFFLLHRPGVSGNYGWLPFVPALLLSISYILAKISIKYFRVVLALVLLSMIPFTLFYGLYLVRIPQGNKWSRILSDANYQNVILLVNKTAPLKGKVYLMPQSGYPHFMLRSDIHWSYYEKPEVYDVLVVDQTIRNSIDKNLFHLAYTFDTLQDGQKFQRYIFVKNISTITPTL